MSGNCRQIIEYQCALRQAFGQGAQAFAGLYQNRLTVDGEGRVKVTTAVTDKP